MGTTYDAGSTPEKRKVMIQAVCTRCGRSITVPWIAESGKEYCARCAPLTTSEVAEERDRLRAENERLRATDIELTCARVEIDRLRAENEKLRSALKVIHTWAKVDTLPEYDGCLIPPCLKPQDVMKLCNEALGMEQHEPQGERQ